MGIRIRRFKLNRQTFRSISPLKVAILYALFSGGWILLSDHFLEMTVSNQQLFLELSTLKALLCALFTAFLLYLLLQWGFKELAYKTHHDALTALPNRLLFNELLKQALAQTRHKRGQLAVLFLDLDRFKLINDTMGHNLGDLLLKAVAERIRGTLREGDTIARQGGDEFLVLLPEISHDQEAVRVSERILAAFTQPFIIDDSEVYMSTSVGISLYPRGASDIESLVKQADTAMYYAKELGRNNCQLFTNGLNIKANERLSTENNLRKALARNEFILHYQPQVDFHKGCIVGLEALVRWDSKEHGLVSPLSFIPIAEETGLIVPIGEWVLETACRQNMIWRAQGHPFMRMAVNISARQFREPNFVKRVAEILAKTGMEPEWLELEITESIAMENGEASLEMLRRFKELGVRISIDDFGTGFSSLNYLRRMPIDTLKIDQSFIRDISSGDNGKEIVTAIIQLAKNLRLKVVAEGVETSSQWSFLRDKRCDEMQGFLFSKAVGPKEMEMLLSRLA
ncbi:EAL domain-containing protein [Desulfosporosinus sp. PR]|uniref:putative bifunctional diguanylate cyclase/phosphodiesterase n=1 Tax=Candidatus Desulfosporosinus nitrosoreducens TaxID=3401928 RepID=UPI0027F8DB93|nr:EAL domain-containing protein [Desulfosporosinus sp. PR]MDQ7095777.1 EAL domain-containing protein [Desulfosporosinus sp. PR]